MHRAVVHAIIVRSYSVDEVARRNQGLSANGHRTSSCSAADRCALDHRSRGSATVPQRRQRLDASQSRVQGVGGCPPRCAVRALSCADLLRNSDDVFGQSLRAPLSNNASALRPIHLRNAVPASATLQKHMCGWSVCRCRGRNRRQPRGTAADRAVQRPQHEPASLAKHRVLASQQGQHGGAHSRREAAERASACKSPFGASAAAQRLAWQCGAVPGPYALRQPVQYVSLEVTASLTALLLVRNLTRTPPPQQASQESVQPLSHTASLVFEP